MPSYKIHSIKDSEKLSFIIEWENESSLNQRLSQEGHIILSIEKTETPLEKLFSFEGKKSDWAYVDGKIAADDIFIAYEMLTKEYKYTLTQLYPETVQDQAEKTKIFSELQVYISEKVVKRVEQKADTSQAQLNKYKILLQKLWNILAEHSSPETQALISELKKLEQNNNTTTILQSLKEILKKLSQRRGEKVLMKKLKPLMREVGIYVPPDIFYACLNFFKKLSQTMSPLVHPKKEAKKSQSPHISTLEEEYTQIHNNAHIHTFLRKKFRQHIASALHKETKKYYFYTLFREKKIISMMRQIILINQTAVRTILFVVIFLYLSILMFWLYGSFFITTPVLLIFLLLIAISLVIRSDTV